MIKWVTVLYRLTDPLAEEVKFLKAIQSQKNISKKIQVWHKYIKWSMS